MHMRDRPFAYEAAGIDQPKSATTPGVLLRALLFSAERGAARSENVRRRVVHGGPCAPFAGVRWVEKSMVEMGVGRMQGVPRPSPTD